MEIELDIKKILKKNKKKVTSERIDIFDYVVKKHIFDSNELLNKFPEIWRASIFRTINLFLEIWIIRKVRSWKSGDSYELVRWEHSHEHMECWKCWEIISFESDKIYQEINQKAEALWFKIEEKFLNISGKCKKCSKK